MMTKKSWEEFRNTGLLLFINQILHVFGWAIAVEIDEDGNVVGTFPARVNYRGFDESSTADSYKKISKYLAEHAKELDSEIKE